MKKIVLALMSVFLLTACDPATELLVTKQPVVIIPDDKAFVCPTVSQLPNPDTLVDTEAGELINVLWKNNQICSYNMAQIKKFLEDQKKLVEKNNTKK